VSLYIHVPFCVHKCHYCDFYSLVDTRDRQGAFVERLIRELAALAPLTEGLPLRTIFVGGGTPTLLAVPLWEVLLGALARYFNLAAVAREGEFTVECNPETASAELFGVLAAGGVTRLSVGAQSFNPRHLATLERRHDPANVARTLDLAGTAGIQRRSVDLIHAIPGQTMADLDADLDAALSLPIEHLSAYTLTYEPNTAMTRRMERGDFTPADEDTEAAMFERVAERALAAGLDRYEISNFARPGAECRHNLAYWRQEHWLAAGPSASGHVAGHRYKNVPRLDDYLAGDDGGFSLVVDHEPPDDRRLLSEILMTGLRLREGLDTARLRSRADAVGPTVWPALAREAELASGHGWLDRSGGRWSLTPAGLLVADGVAASFMAVVAPVVG
jgi:oxygen-independent coproporphyrinogen-3 oxidase